MNKKRSGWVIFKTVNVILYFSNDATSFCLIVIFAILSPPQHETTQIMLKRKSRKLLFSYQKMFELNNFEAKLTMGSSLTILEVHGLNPVIGKVL